MNTIEFIKSKARTMWEYNGMTLFVVYMQIGKDLNFWNGYVLTDVLIPDEQITDIRVHGGVTLNQYGDTQHLYGFDTAHYNDIVDPKSKEWVMNETERFADSITEWALVSDG